MLFVEIELGKKEEVFLSDITKEKIEYYSNQKGKTKGEYLSELIEEKMSKLRHPEQETVHVSRLPHNAYKKIENMILVGASGFQVVDIEESEEISDKYIVEYKDINTNESFWVDYDDLVFGINRVDSILCVPLISKTEVSLSKEEREFIGLEDE